MDSVFSTGLGPILVLWIGALVFYALDTYLAPQDRGTAEVLLLILALGFLIGVRTQIGIVLPYAQSMADLGWPGLSPYLVLERDSWLLSLLVLGLATASSLSFLGRPTAGRSARLALLGAVLLYLAAGDWVTLAFAWGLVDLALLWIVNAGLGPVDSTQRRRLGWAAALGLLAPTLVVAGLALWQASGAIPWVNRAGALPLAGLLPRRPPARAATLLAVAGLLRLMPSPLPSWRSTTTSDSRAIKDDSASEVHPSSSLLLSLLPVLLGAYYWARLAGWGTLAVAQWTSWLPLWGGLLLLITAARAWAADGPADLAARLQRLGPAVVLLIAGAGGSTSWPILVGTSAVLGTATLNLAWTQCQHLDLFDTRTYWRAAPMAVGLLSLAGIPFTAGLPARVALYWSAFTAKQWLALLAMIAGEALYLSAGLRLLLEVESEPESEPVPDPARHETEGQGTEEEAPAPVPAAWQRFATWARRAAEQHNVRYGAATALALAMLALGWAPRTLSGDGLGTWWKLPTLPIWSALLLPVVAAIVLYRSEDRILHVTSTWWPWIEQHLSLDALYRGAGRLAQSVGTLTWGATMLVEGAGYMAWIVLVCLLVLLFIISR